MSTFKFNSLPGVDGISKTVSGIGNISPNLINRKPEKGHQTTGLLSGLDWAVSKGSQFVPDRLVKLILSILSLYFSILRRFIPSFVWNTLILCIPPLLAFYEIALRSRLPLLPSLFAIAFKLHHRGILTIGTVIWLASSLPGDFLGGLGAISGVAMHATAAISGGAAAAGSALVGTATGIAGNVTSTLTHGIDALNPGAVATDISHVLSGGVKGAAGLAGGATQAVSGGLSLVKDGQTAVAGNIAQLVSGEHAIATGALVPDIAKSAVQAAVGNGSAIAGAAMKQAANPLAVIGATQAAAAENVTKVANVLGGVNPLHFSAIPKGSQASQPSALGRSLLRPKLPGLT